MSEKVKEQVEKSIENLENKVKDDSFTQEQALNILVQGIRAAQKRGAFELEETEPLLKAIKVFTVVK